MKVKIAVTTPYLPLCLCEQCCSPQPGIGCWRLPLPTTINHFLMPANSFHQTFLSIWALHSINLPISMGSLLLVFQFTAVSRTTCGSCGLCEAPAPSFSTTGATHSSVLSDGPCAWHTLQQGNGTATLSQAY